ncbi:MAG TPA: response regulator [Stellaceae bacterium]|nr:response regulator [Stellaceae bacterium]
MPLRALQIERASISHVPPAPLLHGPSLVKRRAAVITTADSDHHDGGRGRCVALPVLAPRSQLMVNRLPSGLVRRPYCGAMARILLAEDDDQMRAFLSRGLRRAGHAVDAVADGDAALARAHGVDYDLLLADVVMPGIDGIELARRMTTRQPAIRVMFITGFAAVAFQDDRLAPHRPRIVAKPFHLRHLIEEIEALLSQ